MKRSTGPSARTGQGGDRAAASTRPGTTDVQVGPAGDAFEREADRVADAVVRGGLPDGRGSWALAASPEGIQRKCAECREEEDEQVRRMAKGPEPAASGPQAGEASPAAQAPAPAPKTTEPEAPGLIVEGEGPASRGQMSKAEFLAALRAESCAAVDAALAGTGRDSQGCPWIDHWFGYYEGRSAAQIERALLRYAPEAAGVRTARGYVRFVVSRVRQSASTYAKTGEVTGLPADVPATADAPLDAVGGMFFKARPGGARGADPVSVRQQLGRGQPLGGDVRSRMESAFGRSFTGVEVHADATGAALSSRLNARAFTVGRHVAFGPGEFRPGTIVGDALIAHELAHVVQQGGATRPSAGMRESTAPLERDADRSAVAAVSALWSGTRDSAARARAQAIPALRSGLTLSRCGPSERQKETNRLGDVQLAHMEQRRKEEEEKARKAQEEDARKKGLPPPPPPPKKELSDVTKGDAEKHGLPPAPTAGWDAVVDKPKYKEFAKTVIARVVASVKGTEVEPALAGKTIVFTPEEANTGGFYGLHVSDKHEIHVSLEWIKIADANPKDVWENLVHEGLGHGVYGNTYSWEITMAALRNFSDAERKKIMGDPKSKTDRQFQKFYEAYGYPETEIYASLWQRRYQHPETGPAPKTGGVDTDTNIPDKLIVMQSVLEPSVMLAVLKHLKKRVDENKEILPRDKKFFVDQVKAVLKIDL